MFDNQRAISYNYDIRRCGESKFPPNLTADEARLIKMLKALDNPVRFRIVCLLAERQECITNTIVAFTDLAQSTVSQHLKVLREAGLVHGEVEGPATCYCLDKAGIRWLKEQVATWLAEWEQPMDIEPEKHAPCC